MTTVGSARAGQRSRQSAREHARFDATQTGLSSFGGYCSSYRTLHTSPVAADQAVLTMPALSPTMTEGNLAIWKKKIGDKISPGDVLAEVETDKATVAFEATEPGFLAKILIPGGSQKIQVGSPIAIVVDTQAEVAAAASASVPAAAAQPKPSAPPAQSAASTSGSAKTTPTVPFTVLNMPALSPTMSEGSIVSWKKKVGDKIKAGDALAEIETDKATVTFEATEDGILAKILPSGAPGSKVAVNTPVAVVVEQPSHVAAVADFDPSVQPAASSPKPTSSAAAPSPAAPVRPADANRIFASPLAKRMARESQIELSQVSGSGPMNRVIAADIRSFASRPREPAQLMAAPQPVAMKPSISSSSFTDMSTTNIRRVIAQRLSQSKQTIPHYYLTMECQVDQLLHVREQLNSLSQGEFKLSVNDFIVKAAAMALKKVPEVNSEWRGDVIRRYHNIDINVAISAPQGLFTPIIRDADRKGLSGIALEVKELADKAKSGKLVPDELTTGTFTISNLGMFGVSQFAAVINPPQACILAVGASEKKIVPNPNYKAEQSDSKALPYSTANYISVTLSCDHRVVDGAVGAQWLQVFRSYIENPMKLML